MTRDEMVAYTVAQIETALATARSARFEGVPHVLIPAEVADTILANCSRLLARSEESSGE